MSYETRPQAYDETIKILEKKDHRGIAEFILPSVKEAEEVTLEHTKLSVPDMREMDYLAKIKLNQENFILHIEFESAYRSNIEMQKRMLRYYTYIKWHNDLPIYQVLVLLKKPDNVKRIKNGINSRVQGLDVMRYRYGLIKTYEIDKYEVLAQKQVVLYPLRVFMKYDGESEEEHIQECLTVTEGLEDKDYYFLTLECIKRLYIMRDCPFMGGSGWDREAPSSFRLEHLVQDTSAKLVYIMRDCPLLGGFGNPRRIPETDPSSLLNYRCYNKTMKFLL